MKIVGAYDIVQFRLNCQIYVLGVKVLESALSYPWPTFRYVTMLIVSPSSSSAWTCLALLLQSTPNLEVLILDHVSFNLISIVMINVFF